MQTLDPASLLDWYVSVGVDVALDEDPVDRFLESVREAEARRDAPPPAVARDAV